MTKADLVKVELESETKSNEPADTEVPNKNTRKMLISRITFLICLALAGYVCYLSTMRYFTWMAQTVIDQTDVHISEIPFPAVTICPIMNIITHHNLKSPYIKEFLDELEKDLPSSNNSIDFNDEGLSTLDYLDDTDGIFEKISFKCEDFFYECTWRRIKRKCCSLFRRMPYGKRMCYSFNSLMVEKPDPTWPWSEAFSGRNSGLRVTIKTNASVAMSPKVLAMIHYPEKHLSTTSSQFIQGEVNMAVDALKIFSEPGIRQLYPELRHCYFSDEIIKYGKISHECMRDCRIAYINRMCNCTLPVFLDKLKQQSVYCNTTHLRCIYKHKDGLFTGSSSNINEGNSEYRACKCYPNCNHVQYRAYLTYDSQRSTSSTNDDSPLVDLEVYYIRDTIFSYRTAMVYNLLDLTVALCSIIALFLGVSFISIIKGIQDHFERRRIARAIGKPRSQKHFFT